VTERRQYRRQRRLTQPRRRVVRGAEMHFNRRRLAHSQQAEGVEILLHHPAALDGDRLVERGPQAIEYSALSLVVGARGIDDLPADIACGPDLVHFGSAIGRAARLYYLGEI